MNKNFETTIFFIILCAIVLIIAEHNFVRYYVKKDYPLHVFTVCNTKKNNCFEANPDVSDPTFQTGPYEKVEITATYAPSCLDEHTCSDFSCYGIRGTCQIIYCSPDTKENGENCSNQNQ